MNSSVNRSCDDAVETEEEEGEEEEEELGHNMIRQWKLIFTSQGKRYMQ